MKLEINFRKKTEKTAHTWRLNNMLLKKQWVKEDIRKDIKEYLEMKEKQKHNFPKSMGQSNSSLKKGIYSDPGLPQETRKISHK